MIERVAFYRFAHLTHSFKTFVGRHAKQLRLNTFSTKSGQLLHLFKHFEMHIY